MDGRAIRWAERGVVALAAVVRLAALRTFEGTAWSRHPMVDAATFWSQAQAIVAGRDAFPEGFYQPPAYPLFLAGVIELAGEPSLVAVRLVQAALGVLATWLVVRTAARLGAGLGAPWAGAAAGLVFALYPTAILFELDLLSPALTNACLAGALFAVARPGPRARHLAAGGLLVGLAAALHPSYLLAGLVVAGWAVRERLRDGLLVAAFLALPILPTTVVNLRDHGTLTPVSYNAGINLYLGNNPGWRDTAFLRPGLPFRRLALEADPARRDLPARDRYWRRRALAAIAEAPDAWAATLLTKALWSVSDTEIPRNEDYRCRTRPGMPMRWVALLPVRWGWVFPLAVAGAVLAWRRGGRPGRLLGPLWAGLHLPLVLFLVADRYRLATWPVVAVLAPLGLAALVEAVRRRRPAWALVVVPAALPWLPLDPRTAPSPANCAYAEANLAFMEGDTEAARAGYEAVLAVRPDDMSAHWWLGQLALKRGDRRAAIRHFEAVARAFPDWFPVLKELGRQNEKLGDLEAAERWYRRAWEVPGDRTPTGALLVRVLVKLGRVDEARALAAAHPELARHPRVRELLGEAR